MEPPKDKKQCLEGAWSLSQEMGLKASMFPAKGESLIPCRRGQWPGL